jgi:Cu(I)/Ag(I) efflux system membrane protein CusA/SilA
LPIAIGAMVDAAIVMIENAHKHLEAFRHERPNEGAHRLGALDHHRRRRGRSGSGAVLLPARDHVVVRSGVRAEAQEGRLFSPLAFTKTYAMAAAAGVSVTLVPVLMGYLIQGTDSGRDPQSAESGADCSIPARAAIGAALSRGHHRLALGVIASTALPLARLGGEFIPPLDEGTSCHAFGVAGDLDGKGGRAPADHRPVDSYGA